MPREYKQFYRRKLPHRHSPGATLFVTFRLAGSIPKSLILRYKKEKLWLEQQILRSDGKVSKERAEPHLRELRHDFERRWFKKFELELHKAAIGPTWLKNPKVAKTVAESLHFLDGKAYNLIAFCIMWNDIHTVFKPLLNEHSLVEIVGSNPLRFESNAPTQSSIMESLKGYTARQANKILGRTGKFWEAESYDHEIKDQESMARIVRYVLNNPVKAGLVSDWQEWPWTWLTE